LDHSNKVLPASKLEAMSEYFSKAAMSVLGCQIFWTGKITKNGRDIDGLFVWFVDFVMENSSLQEARDLMSCIQKFLDELNEVYLVEEQARPKGF
jgi:hypothetical protein